jgi:hypothetical protein
MGGTGAPTASLQPRTTDYGGGATGTTNYNTTGYVAPQWTPQGIEATKKADFMAAGGTPYTYAMQEHPIMMGLSQGMMGFGQGMTGQPFLTNFNNIQAEAGKTKSEQDFNKWKADQEIGIANKELDIKQGTLDATLAPERLAADTKLTETAKKISSMKAYYPTYQDAINHLKDPGNYNTYKSAFEPILGKDWEKSFTSKLKFEYDKKAKATETNAKIGKVMHNAYNVAVNPLGETIGMIGRKINGILSR